MTYKKKLIEVALPLEVINIASAREKSIRHGHPSTLHLWWARRPLAAARAVIFAQMVDDPSAHPDIFKTEKAQEKERQRLFRIIEELVKWENTTNEKVLQQARDEIWQSWRYTCAENADHPRAKELFDRYKLPAETVGRDYQLEYGSDRIEIHVDAIQKGDRVLLVDDLIATGGTAEAAAKLIEDMGGIVVECCFVIDLPDIGGRARLEKLGLKGFALCEFEGD